MAAGHIPGSHPRFEFRVAVALVVGRGRIIAVIAVVIAFALAVIVFGNGGPFGPLFPSRFRHVG